MSDEQPKIGYDTPEEAAEASGLTLPPPDGKVVILNPFRGDYDQKSRQLTLRGVEEQSARQIDVLLESETVWMLFDLMKTLAAMGIEVGAEPKTRTVQ